MNDSHYRALLDYRMCGDGVHHSVNMDAVDALMDEEARERGFQHWIDAYHGWNPNPEAPVGARVEREQTYSRYHQPCAAHKDTPITFTAYASVGIPVCYVCHPELSRVVPPDTVSNVGEHEATYEEHLQGCQHDKAWLALKSAFGSIGAPTLMELVERAIAASAPVVARPDAIAKYIEWVQCAMRDAGLCIDGGTCHHKCEKGSLGGRCSRRVSGCAPLTGSGLDDEWNLPDAPPKMECPNCKGLADAHASDLTEIGGLRADAEELANALRDVLAGHPVLNADELIARYSPLPVRASEVARHE